MTIIKTIISFVIGNSFWDFLIDIVGSPLKIILFTVVIVIVLFAFRRFKTSQNTDTSPSPPPPSPSPLPPPPLPPPPPPPMPPTMTARIKAVSGPLKGQEWILQKDVKLTVGRANGNGIKFAPDIKIISGNHCEIELRDDGVYINDKSKNGTFFQNGRKLPPDKWVRVTGNFYVVSKNYMFSIEFHKS